MMRHLLSRSLAVAAVALATVTGAISLPAAAQSAGRDASTVSTASTTATTATTATRPDPDGISDPRSDQADLRRTPLKQVRPQTPPPEPARTPVAAKAATAAAGQSCTTADFASRSDSALVSFVKASETSGCLYSLFNLSGADGKTVFTEAHMSTIANAMQSAAAVHTGNNSTNLLQLLLFERAGFYVQSKNTTTMPAWSTGLLSNVYSALDTLVASPHFLDVDDDNGKIGHEALWLTEFDLEHHYLGAYKKVLDAYDNNWQASWDMRNFANSVFGPLYVSGGDPNWVSALTADPSLLDTLHDFTVKHLDLAGGDYSFLPGNSATELSRTVQYPALRAKVRPLMRDLTGRSSIPGPTAPVWVGVAGMVDTHDKGNCSYYNACDFVAKLKAASQSVTYNCDATHRIVSQKMTATENAAVCASVLNQDAYFHALVKDNGPIPGEYKGSIELNIFGTRSEYKTYSSWIYGNGTDNGGEFLDGNIADPNNQPRFVTFQELNQADGPWAGDVRNLNHEYTHWLDSRFDTKGSFANQISVPDIWWLEGLAEHVSYGYRNVTDKSAMAEAAKHTYRLSTLWETTYENTNTTRTYPWGHLAVRYMFEKHPQDVDTILAKFRAGDYKGAYAYYSSGIGTRYDADFDTWLDACAAGACQAGGGNAPTADFTASVADLTVTLTDQSRDTDGTITARSWNFGDGTTSTDTNPVKTYAAAGTYTVALTVTDNSGRTATTSKAVTVTGGQLPTCPGSAYVLGQNCSRSGLSGAADSLNYLTVYVPAGATLTITTSGGTGNADLYYNPDTWATDTNATASSTGGDNTETLTVTNPTAGWRYLSLYGRQAYSGVTITTRF
ncbi:collagenase [Embleya sp. AB8]|uniref:collagenase n=1 Tax=Embleya sp. AB8 TaxID=3156304 RepID=UPI003C78825D